MRLTLQQSQFETLSARLLDAIEGIQNEESILQYACRLLGGQLALLVKCHATSSDEPVLVSTYPDDQRTWAEKCLVECRAWYQHERLPATARGFPSEGPVKAGGKQFLEALVAYGCRLSERERGPYELIVFRESPSEVPYSHYHCALGAGLLIPYELIVRAKESKQTADEAKKARADVRLYAGLVSTDVLPNESWSDFLVKVEQEEENKLSDPDFMCQAALLWTGYALRRADRAEGSVDAAAARDWINTKFADAASDALELMGFLVDSPGAALGESHTHSAERLIECDSQFGMAGLLLLLDHTWLRVYRATQQATVSYEDCLVQGPARPPSRSGDPGESRLGTPTDTSGPRGTRTLEQGSDSGGVRRDQWLARLLQLTSAIMARGLAEAAGAPKQRRAEVGTAQSCSELGCKTHLDREIFRMYLALLLAGAPRIRGRYLWLGDDDHRRVAPEVRREFLLNLSRFILGVIGSLQRRNQAVVDPHGVSAVEVLDGLLYVLDRYVHVDLKVDERLNIREHLARGLKIEVERHMASRFYRDHLLHVIDVFLLGHMFLDANVCWLDGEKKRLVEHLSTIIPQDAVGDAKAEMCRRNWAVASLLHDMGYQVSLMSAGPSTIERFKDYFALPRAGFRARWLDPTGLDSKNGKIDDCVGFVKDLAKQLGQRLKLDWLGKLAEEEVTLDDHGVLSALRVAQLLTHADMQESRREDNPLQLLLAYVPAIHAMAHHNLFGETVKLENEPLSCVLRLCDELQEWERRRVDIEKVVKRLYLAIEEGETDAMPEYGILSRLGTNLVLATERKSVGDNFIDEIVITLPGDACEILFVMHYRSAIEARYDAITTFLSKAYSLQHLDLSTGGSDARFPMKWAIRMMFPRPTEYRGITELDIYGIISQQVRGLPELWKFADLQRTGAGLVCLAPLLRSGAEAIQLVPSQSDTDQIAIVVSGSSTSQARYGWLTFDPGPLVTTLVDLKRQVLVKRTLGADSSWLGYT